MRGKVKISQQEEKGDALKALAALGVIVLAMIAAFKYTAPLPRGW